MNEIIRSISAVELDCDYCPKRWGEVNGAGACHAAKTGSFFPIHEFLFQNSASGWTYSNTSGASLTVLPDAVLLDSGTNSDPQFIRTGLSFNGTDAYIVRIIIERVAPRTGTGAWQGTLYFARSGSGSHGYSESYRQRFSDIPMGGISVIDLDMSLLETGGTNWIDAGGTITNLRFDFDTNNGSGDFKVYSVQVGRPATSDEATGDDKCFNTRSTCQVRSEFVNDPVTYRFAKATAHLAHSDMPYIAANVSAINYSPGKLNPGRSLGQRSSLEVIFDDHPHSDVGPGFDKYAAERSVDPYRTGTLWGKWRARQPYIRGRKMRWKRGKLSDGFSGMTSRSFLMESANGPSLAGKYSITSKDPIKLLDGDRAQCPALSEGAITGALDATQRTLNVTTDTGLTYAPTGYATIGQKEIVQYFRSVLGIDGNTLLALHADGADGATTQTDSSSSARTMTSVSSAALNEGWSKWGQTSMQFNGTNQYWTAPDSNDWTFSGDFTIDTWIRPSSLSATRAVFSHYQDANNYYRCHITTAGAIAFVVVSGGSTIVTMSSSNGAITALTTFHVVVTRNGNVWRIFVNGVQVATTTDSDAIPNFSGTFRIGNDGSNFFAGWIDEFRVSNVARWSAEFTPPTGPYANNTDVFSIVRGQFNTEGQTHDAGEAFQECYHVQAKDVSDILNDMMVNYADVDPAYINLTNWRDETTNYNRVLYTGLVAIPTSVKTLVNELIVQAGLAIWWDDPTEQIKLQVLRAISTDAVTYNRTNIVRGSLQLTEQPDKRLSTVQVWFGQINPLKSLDKDNFRSSAVLSDLEAEDDYGQTALEVIYSRWIPFGGLDVAARVCALLLGRYRTPPTLFKFRMNAYSPDLPELGQGVQITSPNIQTALGLLDVVPGQVIRVKPGEDEFEIEVEQQSFVSYDTSDLSTRRITIDVNSTNLNIRTLHDNIYPTPVGGENILFTINDGVTIGSTSINTPALTVGNWPPGVNITIRWNGRVQGKGGNGGNGGTNSLDATDGQNGGLAFYTRYAVNIEFGPNAKIWGGGGGGGGGQRSINIIGTYRGGSGGGGAGTNPGIAGVISNDWGDATAGSNGTSEAGGVGGRDQDPHLWGGNGGGPGLNGQSAYDSANPFNGGGVGGTAGRAIDGVSYCTIVSGSADSRGGEVN